MNSIAGSWNISRRQFVLGGMAVAGGLVLSGCSSDPENAGVSGSGDGDRVLRFHASTGAPDTLDPARNSFWNPLAYDVLIYRGPDGSFQPQLATAWRYVGEGNTTFEIELRPGVTFSDGEPLTADAVIANIEYRRDPAVANQSAQYLAAITEMEAVDELTVQLRLSAPNPLLPTLFSQGQGGPGILASPAALADPGVLATGTYGVGRYRLDDSETVTGDHYTYIPNPDYWNPDDVPWDKVVVHYLPEESAALAALQSGQLDAALATFTIIEAGKQAGLAATGPGFPIVLGLSLVDRAGAVAPALGDVRVRQALNYAIDREKITSAIVGDSGQPTDQLSAPGHDGWNDEPFYPYDPERAEELLSQAGYADGFSIPVRIPNSETHSRITQAIADDLRQIGVELQIEAAAGAQFDQADDATNQAYGAVYIGWGIDTPIRLGSAFWLPDATNNTFDSVDDTLLDLHQQALVADEQARADIDRQIVARVAELAWFLPVLLQGESVLYDDEVVEVTWTDFQSAPTVIELRPAGSAG